MKQGMTFGALAALIIFGGAALLDAAFGGPGVTREIWWGAAVAFVAQVVTYVVARRFVGSNPIVGWGIGSVIRFAVVLVFAFVGVKALGLVMAPALLSLVGFLFVTMLVEPLFLKS